ncbi:MAG: acyl--CoA ligase [Clostridia bacterium]|nr:acyl--CoA ligase [Clostridia bacterium]
MSDQFMNINKTKYRYFMDCFDLSVKRTAIKYTIPVDKAPPSPEGFYNRDYPVVDISNKKFVDMIEKTAKALVALGVKKGDYVVMCSSNVPEMLYMDYALNKIGAIPNYVYPNITVEEMRFYLSEIETHYIYILDEPDIRNMVLESIEGFDIKAVIASGVLESFPLLFKKIAELKNGKPKLRQSDFIINWSDFIKGGKTIKEVKENPYVENDTCSIVHSSGTSKIPKAIMETNENVNAISRIYDIVDFKYIPNNVAVQTIPHFVEYGKTTNHTYLCHNVVIVLIPEMNPKNFYDLIKNFKPHYSYSTPSHIRELVKRPVDMSNSILIVVGGDAFDDIELKAYDYMKENNSNALIYQGYGSSEMSAVTMFNLPNTHKVGSLGKPAGDVKAKIVDVGTFDEITTPNTVGELCLTGPGVTKGYAGNSIEETAEVFKKHPDGKVWVHMGDLAYFDEDGFYFYEGRIKNVIARKSFKFSPKEIEDVVLEHSNVLQCIVVGKFDKEEGQVPSAHIVLKDSTTTKKTLDEIITLVNENVQEFHRPTVYKVKSEIIRTRNNKININGLKLEDLATVHNGIFDAEVTMSVDESYDLNMKLYTNSENVNKEEIIKFIETVGKNEKILSGKIKYIFVKDESLGYIKYVD